jgi:hypothetical protein
LADTFNEEIVANAVKEEQIDDLSLAEAAEHAEKEI